MDSVRNVLAALACAAVCHSAQADRTRQADNADVLERGDCELETKFERRAVRGAAPERESSVRLGCGLGWRTELALESTHQRSEGLRDQAIGAEGKTSLRPPGIGQIGWALSYGAGAQRGGNARWQHSDSFAALEAALKPEEDWQIEARLGSARDHIARSDKTLWALALELAVTDAVEVRVEADGDDRSRPLVSVALRWLFWPEHALLTLSSGTRAGPMRERRFGIGISFEF